MTREVLQMVHDALINSSDALWNEYQSDWRHGVPTRKAQLDGRLKMAEDHDKAIAAIKAALAQPDLYSDIVSDGGLDPRNKQEQKPVAWMYTSHWKGNERFITRYQSELTTYKADEVWPLYTSPPKRQPLTEAAHGIGDKT